MRYIERMGRAQGGQRQTTDLFAQAVGSRRGIAPDAAASLARVEAVESATDTWSLLFDDDPAVAAEAMQVLADVCREPNNSLARQNAWSMLALLPKDSRRELEAVLAENFQQDARDSSQDTAWNSVRAVAACELSGQPVTEHLQTAVLEVLPEQVRKDRTHVAYSALSVAAMLPETSSFRECLLELQAVEKTLVTNELGRRSRSGSNPVFGVQEQARLRMQLFDWAGLPQLDGKGFTRDHGQALVDLNAALLSDDPKLRASAVSAANKLTAAFKQLPSDASLSMKLLFYAHPWAHDPAPELQQVATLMSTHMDVASSDVARHNFLHCLPDEATSVSGSELNDFSVAALRRCAEADGDESYDYSSVLPLLHATDRQRPETKTLAAETARAWQEQVTDLVGDFNPSVRPELPVAHERLLTELPVTLLNGQPARECNAVTDCLAQITDDLSARLQTDDDWKALLGDTEYKRVRRGRAGRFGSLSKDLPAADIRQALQTGLNADRLATISDWSPYRCGNALHPND